MTPHFHFFPRLRPYAILGLVCAWIVGLAACAQPLAWQSSESHDIHIGLIATLTGELASSGRAMVQGAELAAKQVNQAGGLEIDRQRYTVVLNTEDDQDNVDVAVHAARKLIYQDNVQVIVGPQLSRNAIPVAKFVETVQIPMISPVSTNPETTMGKRYVFRATFIDPFQGQVMAQFAHHELGAETAAVLYDIASAYNQGIANVFRQVFEAEGGRVVAFESYTTGEKTFDAQLAVIRDRNPTVLFLPNYVHEVLLQVKQARAMGMNVTLLGADAWGNIPANQRQLVNGAFFTDLYSPDIQNPYTQAFIDQYQQRYGEEPGNAAAATYDTLNILFRAMQNQQKVDSESIRQGLATLGRYSGVTGTIEYRGTGDPIRSVIISHITDGHVHFLKQVDP
jgi:branched-chain amino acid transport system substrate-binding protein